MSVQETPSGYGHPDSLEPYERQGRQACCGGARSRPHRPATTLEGGNTPGKVRSLCAQLVQAGWLVQKRKDLNLFAGQSIAVEEVRMKTDHRRVDYRLYVDRRSSASSSPIRWAPRWLGCNGSPRANGSPSKVRLAAKATDGRLTCVFEASGTETDSTNDFDPEPQARKVFDFPKPYVYGCPEERYLETRRAGSGGQQALNETAIQRFPVLVAPLATQSRLVAAWEDIRSSAAHLGGEVARASQRTESLRRSLPAAAFSGELVA